MSQSLVSVIVPVFNASRYLRKCLESLKNQAYDRCEFILIDDGSTDDSRRICDEYCAVDSRFICFSQHNQGVAAARNHGLDVAKGEYIGFVDADDYVEPNMIQTLIQALIESNADVAECSVNLVDEHGQVRSKQLLEGKILHGNVDIVSQYAMQNNTLNYCWNKLYQRSVVGDIRFSIRKTSEDYLFNVMVFNRCKNFISVGDPLYNYVLTSDSATRKQYHEGRLDSVKCGADAFSIQRETYPPLLGYYAVYILEKILTEILLINKSDLESDRKKRLQAQLLRQFKKYYPYVNRPVLSDMKMSYRWKHFFLLRWLPALYIWLFA